MDRLKLMPNNFLLRRCKIRELMELFLRVVCGKGMSADWVTSVAVPIFYRKRDVMNCGMCGCVKLIEHAIKIMKKYLEEIENNAKDVVGRQSSFLLVNDTVDAIFLFWSLRKNFTKLSMYSQVLWTRRNYSIEFFWVIVWVMKNT